MYCYILYLLGFYTYEEEQSKIPIEELNMNEIESKIPIFPQSTTIIKNRELIINKDSLHSKYGDVINELKEKLKDRKYKTSYDNVLNELKEKINNNLNMIK